MNSMKAGTGYNREQTSSAAAAAAAGLRKNRTIELTLHLIRDKRTGIGFDINADELSSDSPDTLSLTSTKAARLTKTVDCRSSMNYFD